MANVQAITDSFRVDMFNAIHAFGTTVVRAGTGADTFKAALFFASASLGTATTAYSTTGEATGTNYTAGGVTVTNGNAPAVASNVGYWTPSASFVWTTLTISTAFDAVLLYNSTQSNKAIAVFTFGSQTITAGTLTISMPSNTSSTALLRLA